MKQDAKPSQLIAGLHSVRTALRQGASAVAEIWVEAQRKDQRVRELIALAADGAIPVHSVDRDALNRLAPGVNHQGVIARARVAAALDEAALYERLQQLDHPPLLLILDGVQDPHNLGACLRSADGAGVDLVIAPRDRAVGLTQVACKVASGAADTIPFVQVTNLARTLERLKKEHGIWLIGTQGEAGQSIYQADLTGPLALVLGGEEKGIRRLTSEACDYLVHLPMLGAVESLNVSVACGICLYEALRQRS